ncbi:MULTISPECIES: hypothetical protein [Aneurinibacillus]|uniref:Uncharacterized protein n=1 Tax=Aneurinibacillus thermoaerophilus TaxID=143495 RepID=A0A1G7XRA4_ANETH|nr:MULTISPECIES: hypothetical protein [Aneurinibacillus]AMA73707.1 hypothetical protein ACH33_13120 [Aneurinibacillus sp. XH2]MED0679486.1 hypothetical protein [Aneurinibacillus thermoaerophilus]MED0737943.1 hypothetical protein [Aneurinibacillus thermoaerophilus]MED0756365.1 hypothetical protein [Aneurinibacillus thermoaerophilus]MED0760200.1 hypothetical protein [Aneurinibacillus thermoaerophilus]
MVRQFLRKVFAGRKQKEHESECVDAERTGEIPWEELAEESASLPNSGENEHGSNRALERRDEPQIYVITREKIEHHSYKQIARIVEDILGQIELGLRREGRLQLRLSPELMAEADEFLGKRIGKYIEGAERETYDATAFFDWTDEETAQIYRTFVLPSHPEKQRTFMQSRFVMIYDTCEALGWDARERATAFAEAIGWELDEADWRRFEEWLKMMSERIAMEEKQAEIGGEPERAEEEEELAEDNEFAHITPIQISREEVEQEDISKLVTFFDEVLQDKERIRQKKAGLVFSFYGFSGELEDVMQNEAVNAWASRLVEQYPYVFYFLNDEYVPMTRFVTSMVVTSSVNGDEIVFNEEELEKFIAFIREALARLAEWTGENPNLIIQEFEQKLFWT